ncbi:MAG: O-antigen ligase family protein [Leptolyngbyaceae cyanobacterium SL_1_1]|nr:O-antigen ligase family protein [Leptolyngbyaceae cyanobacterium RM1_1_2]NJO09908.1 O-antigen ligase family protein [Leptolyngbyaceae cyanobacterium SL_1_1]
MALTVISCFTLSIKNSDRGSRLLGQIGLAAAIGTVILSTSKTGLIVSLLILAILIAYRFYQWKGKETILFLDLSAMALASTAVVVFSFWNPIMYGLGRDPTLTGRTLIWEIVIQKIWQKPLLGYGVSAFWATGSPYAVEVGINVANDYIPPHSHNGFLELALSIGLVGLTLFVVDFCQSYGLALQLAYKAKESSKIWPFAFLSFLLIYNMTESILMRLATIFWVVYVATSISLKLKKQ